MSRCVCFGPVRGDYYYLKNILSNFASFDNKKWKWKTTHTVLISIGNIIGRYDKFSYTRSIIDSKQAIEDEIRILKCFENLIEDSNEENQNKLVVLVGNQELGQILNILEYQKYQITESVDLNVRKQFTNTYLIPFLQNYSSVLVRWGNPDLVNHNIYFCYGTLCYDWLKKIQKIFPMYYNEIMSQSNMNPELRKFLSTYYDSLENPWTSSFQDQKMSEMLTRFMIPMINLLWQSLIKYKAFSKIKEIFYDDPNSCLINDMMLKQPKIWIEDELYKVRTILGNDSLPVFVSGNIPIQMLSDLDFSKLSKSSSVYVHHEYRNRPIIYDVNNATADVFCQFDDSDRQPQSLEFSIEPHGLETKIHGIFSKRLYTIYIKNQITRLFKETLEPCTSDNKLPPASLDRRKFKPLQKIEIPDHKKLKTDLKFSKVFIILFDQNNDYMYLLQKSNTKQWTFPGTIYSDMKIDYNIELWENVEKFFEICVGHKLPRTFNKVTTYDFPIDKKENSNDLTRYFITYISNKDDIKFKHADNIGYIGEWLELERIFEYDLELNTKLALFEMMSNKVPIIKKPENFPKSIFSNIPFKKKI